MVENSTLVSPGTLSELRCREDGQSSSNDINQVVRAASYQPNMGAIELSSTITETPPLTPPPLTTPPPFIPPPRTPPPHAPPPRTPAPHTPLSHAPPTRTPPSHALPRRKVPRHRLLHHLEPRHSLPPHALSPLTLAPHMVPPHTLSPPMPDSTQKDSESNPQTGFCYAKQLIVFTHRLNNDCIEAATLGSQATAGRVRVSD